MPDKTLLDVGKITGLTPARAGLLLLNAQAEPALSVNIVQRRPAEYNYVN